MDEKRDITTMDTPKGLILSDLERKIIEKLSDKKTIKDISMELGVPKSAISNLVRKPEVADFIQELIEARNQMMKMYLPDLLMSIIEDKVAKNLEDGDGRLADLTRKDVVDVAKQLNDMLKTTSSGDKDGPEDQFTKLYQQINVIQNGNK